METRSDSLAQLYALVDSLQGASPTVEPHPLEITYWVVVATAAAIGLLQLWLLKKDGVTRNTRASREAALQAAERYADCITMFAEERVMAGGHGIAAPYPGTVPADPSFDFSLLPNKEHVSVKARIESGIMIGPLNKLEAVAAAFVSGVADKDVVFTMMAPSFCAIVHKEYDIVAYQHSLPNSEFYSNVITLYRYWSAKLSRSEIEASLSDMNERLASIKEGDLPVIGPVESPRPLDKSR